MPLYSISLLALLWSFAAVAQKQDTIYTDSGLKYLSIQKGKGSRIKDGYILRIYYTGKLSDGTVFDSNLRRRPLKIRAGAGELIEGWEEGLLLMKSGEKGVLWIPAHLGYGTEGVVDPDNASRYIIPPDEDLIFEIEILEAYKRQ